MDGPTFCAGFADVRKWEFTAISERCHALRRPIPDPSDLTGIAVSGGGIRSASFSLGVIQKLAHDGVLRNVHYLSTVSGGGYMGSSLTWYLTRKSESGFCYGTHPKRFPFLGGQAAADRLRNRSTMDEKQKDPPPPDGRTIVDFIRQRSSYLVPGRGLGLLWPSASSCAVSSCRCSASSSSSPCSRCC